MHKTSRTGSSAGARTVDFGHIIRFEVTGIFLEGLYCPGSVLEQMTLGTGPEFGLLRKVVIHWFARGNSVMAVTFGARRPWALWRERSVVRSWVDRRTDQECRCDLGKRSWHQRN
jgi:hypothetical protein